MGQRPITGTWTPAFASIYGILFALVTSLLVAVLFPLPPPLTPSAPFENYDFGRITLLAFPEVRVLASISDRVLLRLEEAEAKETDPWMRDDIRIAWITVLYASRGNHQPHIDATYRVLGIHPAKVWPAIARRHEAILGRDLALVDTSLTASCPKKPCASVKSAKRRAA
jgi:hypothetical protein